MRAIPGTNRQRLSVRCGLFALLFGIAGCWAAEPAEENLPLAMENGFDIQLPLDAPVEFHGSASMDGAGGPKGQILYPGVGGLAGLLAGIATHGALVEADKASEKTRIQKDADKLLAPYREALQDFSLRQLSEPVLQKKAIKGLGHLINTTETGSGFVLQSTPVFLLTADRRALILENTLTVYPTDGSTKALYQNTFKVVSDPRNVQDLEAFWGNDGARELKRASQALFARSLEMAVAVLEDPSRMRREAEKTIRFYEGGTRQIERGRVVDQACDRFVVLNLRGWLMSVPTKTASDTACETAAL